MIPSNRKMQSFVFFCLLLVLLTPAVLAKKKKKKQKKIDTSKYVRVCKGQTLKTKRDHAAVSWLVQTTGDLSIRLDTSPQHEAACWMLFQDKMRLHPSQPKFAQRYALVVLYFATKGGTHWGIKTNWVSTNKSECSWYGVMCNRWGTVVGLDLGFNELNGLLPRELALLQSIKEVDLHGNDLQGVIPTGILHSWTECEVLRLHMNGFFGSIHPDIRHMTKLRELHLFGNYFGSRLPSEIDKLKNLEVLDLYANALEGPIPRQLANLANLRELDLHDNFFTGTMPQAICDRRKGNLQVLIADCWGSKKEVQCDCCTICCEGLPHMRCVDMSTRREIIVGLDK